jgi:phosphoglycolate phosphatase-like HAD superfamily hydrolase
MNLKKYKHFSFDLDGTLVHTTAEYRYKLVPEVIQKAGGKPSSQKMIDKFWFESSRDEVVKEHFGLDPVVFWDHYCAMEDMNTRKLFTEPYHDAERFLRILSEKGLKTSIITGAPKVIAEMEIEQLNGVPIHFFLPLKWDSEFEKKPDPGGLLHVMKELQAAPEETLYIGNSNEDAMFAKNAGADFIYLERKEHDFDMKDVALHTIQSLDQLIDFL